MEIGSFLNSINLIFTFTPHPMQSIQTKQDGEYIKLINKRSFGKTTEIFLKDIKRYLQMNLISF
ncbi:MAG: hypothetical protein UZ04_CHB001000834 [Chlorobi bacterium OLB4]|jgi:hypothetical protein|nr:MAG: hypothetical protein UZ04_CHB001000834 [Chlorobi bacterium OLB4]OQY79127.1 MAG: hypothetical protein B6D43_00585 [Ignavibacteriales bacterium UTCHB1]